MPICMSLCAMLLRSLLHVVIPPNLQFEDKREDRSVYDEKYSEYPITTFLNRMGPNCQAVLSCLLWEFSQCSKISDDDDEKSVDDKKEMDLFIYEMSCLCGYGRAIRTAGHSDNTMLFCKYIRTSNDYRMFITPRAMQYIEYFGPVYIEAVREVSAFIQSGGKGTMPPIDTLVRVIFSMCTVRDNKWSMEECEYLTSSGKFDPTELERCIADDMGKEGNGGMDAEEYFNIPRDAVYDQYGNILPNCCWTKDEEEEEDEDEEPWRVGDGKGN